ncbi:uncharacterized protein LOC134658621 [Cydia amplana]|uniref:uncharacterized protein LOC134658621 n=1 Tax=Cydia amplana TaxID=1869771 RepID=UPI002FE5FA41
MSDDNDNNSDVTVPPAVQAENPPSTSAIPTTGVFRVGIRVPPFWPEEPAVWFAQLESQFTLSGITSDTTKFYHVIGKLDPQFAIEVKDIILSPPESNKYDKLKAELIRRLSVSQEQKIRQLMLHEELGDRKPTQFLRHLRSLAGPSVPDDFLRQVWSGRLPNNVQTIVASQPRLPLDDIAELADRIQELAPSSRHVASTSAEPTGAVSELSRRVDQLAQQVEALLSEDNMQRRGNKLRGAMYIQVGKHSGQAIVAENVCPISSGRLFMTDRTTKTQYLIDTGSDLCVFPRLLVNERRKKTDYELYAANSTVIATYGYITLHLDFGLRRIFEWRFTVADVSKPIIGVDFLIFYNLLVDCRNQKLIDKTTSLFTDAQQVSAAETISSIRTTSTNDSMYTLLLRDFPDITRPAGKLGAPKHDTVHHIRTTPGPPVSSRPRRLDPERLKIAKKEFDDMLQNGTARRSESPWSSPLHLVRKKNNEWRPCGDYRALNARTIPDQYPVRHIQDFAYMLAGKNIFSTIDLIKAYNQIRVYGPDIPKTSITTPFGMFEFPFMTFGLRNAAQTFQRFMDELLRGFDFAYGYLDDILISSSSEIEHKEHLSQLFRRLQDYGVLINTSKCVFGQSEVTFLGYRVSAQGISPLESKVQAINDFPAPQTVKELRRYLGMLNFYRRFVPGAAKILAPLTALLAGDPKASTPIVWTPALRETFQLSKSHLSKATLLAHPDSDAELALQTDASDVAIGAVLQQRKNGLWEPLAFFSKKLNSAQQKYSPYDRELLVIYEAIKYFRYMVEARSFTILTDHKPLTFAFMTNRDKCSPRQFRYLDFISQFSTDIRFVSGKDNIVADALSRIEELTTFLDYQALAEAQTSDTELSELLQGGSSLQLQKITSSVSGFRYCLTIVDRFTRWPEAYPLQDITADTCAAAFVGGWIARFGCPERITTDRGRQFESQLFKKISALMGSTHLTTTAYHPAANGLVERLHRQLKAAIMCHATTQWTEALPLVLLGIRSAWKEDLNSSPAELLYGEPLTLPGQFFSSSSSESVVDICDFASRLRKHMSQLSPQPTSWHTSSNRPFYIPKDLKDSAYVFLRQGPERRSLEAPYQGPFKVLRHGVKTFDIEVNGKAIKVTIDRLKPAYLARDDFAPFSSPVRTGDETASDSSDSNHGADADDQTSPDQGLAQRTRSGRHVRFPAHLQYYRP